MSRCVGAYTGTSMNSTKCLLHLEAYRRSNFFNPPSYLCAVIYLTEICDEGLGLLVLNVTCNDISVIYVTAQMCKRAEEVVPSFGIPTP